MDREKVYLKLIYEFSCSKFWLSPILHLKVFTLLLFFSLLPLLLRLLHQCLKTPDESSSKPRMIMKYFLLFSFLNCA